MKIELFYAPVACSMVPYINLTEAGAEFSVRTVNFRKSQHLTPEYLKINPLHKVPMLSIDGHLLAENVAINTWIARTFPTARLLPSNPLGEMQAISHMGWFGSGIHPHLTRINSPAKFCDVPGTEESVKKLARDFLAENFAVADERLKGREFFFDHYTVVDAYFFWCVRRASQLGAPIDPHPAVKAHFERMQQRDSVKKLLAFEAKTLDELAKA